MQKPLAVAWYLVIFSLTLYEDVRQMIDTANKSCQISQNRDVKEWLSPPNPSTNHNAAKEKHLEGTGQWFLESNEFLTWIASPNSALWLHGIPGCGKTILSSTIIQHLHHIAEKKDLVYFFFDFSDTSKQTFDKMIRSLIFQLACLQGAAKENLDNLYQNCGNGKDQPDLKSLCSTFQQILEGVPELTIVLDALDECERASRGSLMRWIENLGCRVLMTSRKLEDIQSSIDEWEKFVSIFSFQESPVGTDIRAYIRQKLGQDMGHTTPRSSKRSKLARKWKGYESLLTEIEMKLTEKADGM